MGRKQKLGLTIFSILLWAQLVFSIGITAWRYWLIDTGQAELFVSTSPRQIDPLLDEAALMCPSSAALFYLGDEPSFYYARYRLYPRRVAWLRSDQDGVDKGEDFSTVVEARLMETGGDVCLLVDRTPIEMQLQGEIVAVTGSQAIHIIRK